MLSSKFLAASAALCFALTVSAQQPTDPAGIANSPTADIDTPSIANEGIGRYLELNTVQIGLRFRQMMANTGYHYFEDGQQRSVVDGRFKFDRNGKYSIHFHLSSGRTFNWSYADVIGPDLENRYAGSYKFATPAFLANFYAAAAADPVGEAEDTKVGATRGWEMYFRQLYFAATPVKELSFEYGSLGIERGAGTEATTYDDDGYLEGGRVRILDPKHIFVDQVIITFGFEGNIFQPNFFARGNSLGQFNYQQYQADKRFGHRLDASLDYTVDKGTHIVREAALLKIPEARVIDQFRPELYQRLNNKTLSQEVFPSAQGFALTASKTFAKQFRLDAGFARIDQGYGVLTGDRVEALLGFSTNGDAFLTGTRVFTRANWKVMPYLTLFGYYTRELITPPAGTFNYNSQAVNTGVTVDFKPLLTKMHVTP